METDENFRENETGKLEVLKNRFLKLSSTTERTDRWGPGGRVFKRGLETRIVLLAEVGVSLVQEVLGSTNLEKLRN